MMLKSSKTISNVAGYSGAIDPPPLHEPDRPDVALTFHEVHGGFNLTAFGPSPPFPSDGLNSFIPLTSGEVFEIAANCRETWQRTVVEYSETVNTRRRGIRDEFSFKEGWDLAGRPDILEGLRTELAKAGEGLFFQVFEKQTDEALTELVRILKGDGRFTLRITSDSFYVPWGLMYTHSSGSPPLGSDFSNASDCGFGGFWGIRHTIQHKPMHAPTKAGRLEAVDGKLPTAAYVDDQVFAENQLPDLNKDWEHLTSRLQLAVRRTRREFENAFGADPLVDRLTYFFCHGTGADNKEDAKTGTPRIVVSRDFKIDRVWLENLRRNRKLKPPPFIFINSCQGGQVNTLFYKSPADAFLSLDAIGTIGPQIDIPAKFAAEYGKSFLGRLLKSPHDGRLITVGSIVRDLAEEFVRDHRNPLGLVYSLYYGGDCQVDLGIDTEITTNNDRSATAKS